MLKALRMAAEARAWPQLVRSLIGWAGSLAGQGQAEQERAVECLAQVLAHPLSWQEHRVRAEHLLDELRAALPPGVFDEAMERGQACTLESTVEGIVGIRWLP